MTIEDFNVDSWRFLKKRTDSDQGYDSEFIMSNSGGGRSILIFIDEKSDFHFVCRVLGSADLSKLISVNINGLSIGVKDFKIKGQSESKFIDVSCGYSEFLTEFTAVAKEIAFDILEEDNDVVDSINNRISKWQAFWGIKPKNVLPLEKQIGLIAELEFLINTYPEKEYSIEETWKGPAGHLHDFVFDQFNVEIKGSLRKEHIHIINGLNQLDDIIGKELFFASYLFEENKSGNTINYYIDKAESLLLGKPIDLFSFQKLIIGLGYSKVGRDQYDNFKFSLSDFMLFVVDERFPRITPREVFLSFPSRISKVKYSIDLSGMTSELDYIDL